MLQYEFTTFGTFDIQFLTCSFNYFLTLNLLRGLTVKTHTTFCNYFFFWNAYGRNRLFEKLYFFCHKASDYLTNLIVQSVPRYKNVMNIWNFTLLICIFILFSFLYQKTSEILYMQWRKLHSYKICSFFMIF